MEPTEWIVHNEEFSYLAVAFAAASLFGQTPVPGAPEKPAYNAELARQLGADDMGMKKYVMAFLKRGPTKLTGAEGAELQRAHLKNIIRLADEGKLLVAGPFGDDGDVRGIFILNVETVEEAKKLTETDPAVRRGTLVFELRPWHGSAALMESGPDPQDPRKEKRGRLIFLAPFLALLFAFYARSKRSRFITLFQAATKSWTNFFSASELP